MGFKTLFVQGVDKEDELLEKVTDWPRGLWGSLRWWQRNNRVAPVLSSQWERELGVGQSWMPLSYGEYYPRSVMVYSALRIRQEAVARPPLTVYKRTERRGTVGSRALDDSQRAVEPVGPNHPVQRLLDSPNAFWTRGDLWRATETYLGLWGSAFWGLERDEVGRVVEIWPLRSDRMRVVPDPVQYVKGFVYVGRAQQMVSYVPEDVVWLRYFNPLDEYSGMSPIAPLRLSVDMSLDALRTNRSSLANESVPGLFIETTESPTDDEVKEFYSRWESRYRGPDRARRPALLSAGMKPTNLGFSPREMEYVESLRWSLEDVGRAYGVPKAMLGDMERATFSNFQTARRVFWEDTVVPQLRFFEEVLNQKLIPLLGDPSLFVEFDTSVVEALRDSENDKASRRQKYVSAGIMTVDEVRAEMNLPPRRKG